MTSLVVAEAWTYACLLKSIHHYEKREEGLTDRIKEDVGCRA